MIGLLKKIEGTLQSSIEGGSALTAKDVQPLDIVRQIEREIERNKREFIKDQTYVAHKMVIHLYAPSPGKVEEYEALFNNAEFQEYLEDYIHERGYQLLDRIRIAIQCHQDPLPQFRKRQCFVEFSWPQVGGDPGEVTVMLDPENERKILSVTAPRNEVPQEVWLEVISGEAYRSPCRMSRREFNIGRGENVVNNRTGSLLRVNHLAFKPPATGDVANRSVSRQHARIVLRGDAFLLYDTGSQNGTCVERGKSVHFVPHSTSVGEAVELKDQDVIVLGSARVRFRIGTQTAPIASQREEAGVSKEAGSH
jgi:hypothetical protein